MIGLLFLMAAILLTYTLADWSWQQRLGWWNYAVAIALIPIDSVLMRLYRPDQSGRVPISALTRTPRRAR